MMEFRDALKSFRSDLGLAQTDVAKAPHISVATVGRWETGGAVNFSAIDDQKAKYPEQLHLRREYTGDAIAVAHYNVTRGTVV